MDSLSCCLFVGVELWLWTKQIFRKHFLAEYGICYFIAGSGDKDCRAPLKRGRDISSIFEPYCLKTVTGHTVINVLGEANDINVNCDSYRSELCWLQ